MGARLQTLDARRVGTVPKSADPLYQSGDYRVWREAVIAKAGGRCEAVDAGQRCSKAQPRHRMFADHVKEVRDGGARFDPANGQCLCGAHHTAKTARARAARRWT
ncbi:MAG: HNH endonuclease signature motif containing protein [Caulobacteraceae bacterium]